MTYYLLESLVVVMVVNAIAGTCVGVFMVVRKVRAWSLR